LTAIPGPSGHEDAVMRYVRECWAPHVDNVELTRIGNLVAHIANPGAPKLLIQAHADELGYIVTGISDDGYLWINTGQGSSRMSPQQHRYMLERRHLIGHPCQVLTRSGIVEGLFATTTGHITSGPQLEQPNLTWNDVWVDVYASSRAEVEALGVHVGSPIVPKADLQQRGNRLVGKCLDDRMGIALMTALLEGGVRADLAYDLYLGVTIQEENGLVGAQSLPRYADFDLAIALDNGLSADIPPVDRRVIETTLGKGPSLVYKDSSMHYTIKVIRMVEDIAARRGIPFQRAVFLNYGSDGAAFIRNGIPTALLAPPIRYTHSVFETIDIGDLDHTLDLLRAFVSTPPENVA
jgi:endoglucanase